MGTINQPEQKGLMAYPTESWRKVLFKSPITLWRLGLAPIFDWIIMLVTQWGRNSGLPRHTMIEYHRLNGVKYAACAFCPKSDWYKNILADSRVTIQTSDGIQSAKAVRVTDDQEILEVYKLFLRRDPPVLKLYLKSLNIKNDPTDVVANKDRIYWFRFDPTDQPTPPPLQADLVWVWPLLAVIFAVSWKGFGWLRRSITGTNRK
jgi:deazaflavin-dependent oxidoreductase (nitroreductase family)